MVDGILAAFFSPWVHRPQLISFSNVVPQECCYQRGSVYLMKKINKLVRKTNREGLGPKSYNSVILIFLGAQLRVARMQ